MKTKIKNIVTIFALIILMILITEPISFFPTAKISANWYEIF